MKTCCSKFSLTFVIFILACFTINFSVLPQNPSIDESLTISTYYPSPYGVYKELYIQRMARGRLL